MITQELLDYISQSLQTGVSKEAIFDSLVQNGWIESDVNEGFASLNSQQTNFASNGTNVKYAGFWIRYVAYFIDGFILSVVLSLISLLPWVFFKDSAVAMAFFFLIELGIVWGYFIFMTYKYQATWGKKMVGIYVRGENGGAAPLGKIILRETIGKIISNVVLYIGFIMAAFTKKKQAGHDMMASTVVVFRDPDKKVSKWLYAFLLVPVIIIALIASSILLFLNAGKNNATQAQLRNVTEVSQYPNQPLVSTVPASDEAIQPQTPIDNSNEKSNAVGSNTAPAPAVIPAPINTSKPASVPASVQSASAAATSGITFSQCLSQRGSADDSCSSGYEDLGIISDLLVPGGQKANKHCCVSTTQPVGDAGTPMTLDDCTSKGGYSTNKCGVGENKLGFIINVVTNGQYNACCK